MLPGTTEAELHAELAAALGSDVPHEVALLEPPTGGSVSPVDTPLYDVVREWVATNE